MFHLSCPELSCHERGRLARTKNNPNYGATRHQQTQERPRNTLGRYSDRRKISLAYRDEQRAKSAEYVLYCAWKKCMRRP